MNELAEAFANSNRSVVVAAAGCGKTELIVRAVSLHSHGKQLILTHTNAGVRALLNRLKQRSVASKSVQVDTIDGWALRYAAAYPSLSGLKVTDPASAEFDWTQVHGAAVECIRRKSVSDVVSRSYAGVFVDEYQDCTVDQHELIMVLAKLLPCRIVGDPLQGIFDFTRRAVDWNTHVKEFFENLGDLEIPYRWIGTNPELGSWLSEARKLIVSGNPIDLRNGPIVWATPDLPKQIAICKNLLGRTGESVVAIGKWEVDCCKVASSLGGRYDHMETIECKPLIEAARGFDSPCGRERVLAAIDLAEKCLTGIKSPIKTTRKAYEDHKTLRLKKGSKYAQAKKALAEVFESPDKGTCLAAMEAMERSPGAKLYRRELWQEVKRTLRESIHSDDTPLSQLAWKIRDTGRRFGRKWHRRTVSRTLLIKGLEFDHAVILNADKLDAKNLYVAMTRGTKSLTVLSEHPVIQKAVPKVL
jgi:hypothetical protein